MRTAALKSLEKGFQVENKVCVSVVIALALVVTGCHASQGNGPVVKQVGTIGGERVFTAGSTFSVTFTLPPDDENGVLFWRDHQGNPTTSAIELNGHESIILESPGSKTGYYGLVYQSPAYLYEYGFVIQPNSTDSPEAALSDQFGMVHANYQDPHLSTWIKTLTWQTVSEDAWPQEIAKRRAEGKLELPLVVGREWSSDSSQEISDQKLLALENRLTDYLSADPTVTYWELGLEENLQDDYSDEFYWSNLYKKVLVARDVANRINPDIQFIYQIGGRSREAVLNFAQSDAAEVFDILALHPYGWPEFLDPDSWYPEYLDEVASIMELNALEDMPLWVTEIGIPQHIDRFGGYFSSPEGRPIRGSSWGEAAINLVKMHVISMNFGIEKVFWYNYADRGSEIDDPEDFFGLLTFDRFPRPAYAAYTNFIRLMQGKENVGSSDSIAGVEIHTYKDEHEYVSVVWSESSRSVPIAALDIDGLGFTEPAQSVNIVGSPVAFHGDTIEVGVEPLFFIQSIQ